jgi:hypothetical protein
MDEDQDLRFFCLWWDKRIDQAFPEAVLAFQHGQACQAHLLETGNLRHFIIDIIAVILSIRSPK